MEIGQQQTESLHKRNAQAEDLHQQLQAAKKQHAQELQASKRAREQDLQRNRANLEELKQLLQATWQSDAEARAKLVAEIKDKAAALVQGVKKDMQSVRQSLHTTEQHLLTMQQTTSAAVAAEKALHAAHQKGVQQLQQDLALAQQQLAEERNCRPVQHTGNR